MDRVERDDAAVMGVLQAVHVSPMVTEWRPLIHTLDGSPLDGRECSSLSARRLHGAAKTPTLALAMATINTNAIEISFLGGASAIGASCTLVRVPGATFVVDCGVRYSGSSPLPDLSQLADVRVDAVLVTHAHMDHSGGLPLLAEACPGAPVFATPPTIDLIDVLLRDSLRIMNAPDRESEVPLYTEPQVEQLLHSMAPVKYHQPIRVGEIEICWLPASHILGAAMILLKNAGGNGSFHGRLQRHGATDRAGACPA